MNMKVDVLCIIIDMPKTNHKRFKVIENVEKGKDLIKAKSVKNFSEKLGI